MFNNFTFSINKGIVLPYPARNFFPELLLILLLLGIDVIRIFLGNVCVIKDSVTIFFIL